MLTRGTAEALSWKKRIAKHDGGGFDATNFC